MKKILILIINCQLLVFNCLAQGEGSRFLFGYESNANQTINRRANLNFVGSNINIDTTDYLCTFSATAANISDSAEHNVGLNIANNGHIGLQNFTTAGNNLNDNKWQSSALGAAQITGMNNNTSLTMVTLSKFFVKAGQNSSSTYYDPTISPAPPQDNFGGVWFAPPTNVGTASNISCTSTCAPNPIVTGGGGTINTGTGSPNNSNTGNSTSSTTYSYIDPNNPTNYSSTDDYFAGQFIAMNLYQQVNNWKADRMTYEKLLVNPSICYQQ